MAEAPPIATPQPLGQRTTTPAGIDASTGVTQGDIRNDSMGKLLGTSSPLTPENFYEDFAKTPVGEGYIRELGPEATAQQAAHKALSDYYRPKIESDPRKAMRDILGLGSRYADVPGMTDWIGQQGQAIGTRNKALLAEQTAKMSPEQAAAYRKKYYDELMPREMRDIVGEKFTEGALGKLRQFEKAQDTVIQQEPEGTGFTDWLASNWKNFLIPGGIVAAMFGGNLGKAIGALAIGYGGYDLYNRYQNIAGDAPQSKLVQQAALESLKYHNPETDQHRPLANIQDLAKRYQQQYGNQFPDIGQRVQQGLQDIGFLTRYGFRHNLMGAATTSAQQQIEGMLGPGIGADQFEAYRAKIPSTWQGMQAAGNRAWETGKDWVRQLPSAASRVYDTGKEWVTNGLQ